MADSEASSIKINVIAGLITTAIIGAMGLIPGLWAWVVNKLSSIWSVIWSHISSTHAIPTWALYLLAVPALMWLSRIAVATFELFSSNEPRKDSYVQDNFFNVTWRWRNSGGSPHGIWAFCPRCDTQLVYSNHYELGQETVSLHCETCRHDVLHESGDKDYLVAKVHRQIDRKIRNGEWRTAVVANREKI